ncbi:hypothetical protein [Bradyrhizobium sp. ORS 111]
MKQIHSLDERLAREAESLRKRARRAGASLERMHLLEKAEQMEKARDINAMLAGPPNRQDVSRPTG